MRALTTGWGAAKAIDDPPRARMLNSLIENERTTPEVVARVAILSALLSERDFDQLTEKAKKSSSPWPRFVARSLTESELPELANFLNSASQFPLTPADAAAADAAAPLELSWVQSTVADSDRPYTTNEPPKSKFLSELLGEKTAAQLLGNDPTPTPKKPVPTPGAGTSRRLGRHTNIAARSSPYLSNKRLIPLGRPKLDKPSISAALERIRRIRGQDSKDSADETNDSGSGSMRDASQTMKKIAQSTQRKTVTILSDDDALPLPSDSQRARKERLDEETRRKAAAAEATKKRRDAREQQRAEAHRKKVARKLEARKQHREQNARSRDYEYTDDDEIAPVEAPSSDESPSIMPRRRRSQPEEVTNLENDDTPVPKKLRVTDEFDESRVPRRSAEKRSDDERWMRSGQSFARPANGLRSQARVEGPTMMRPPPVFSSGGRRGTYVDEFPEAFEEAVGDYRENLNEHQIREILDFVTLGPINPKMFDKEGKKEYVLNEFQKYSLLLRLCDDGTWQRVRYNAL